MEPKHRKTIKHVHEPGDLHELTFSCYQRRPLLVRDDWRKMLSKSLNAALQGVRVHAGACASAGRPAPFAIGRRPGYDRILRSKTAILSAIDFTLAMNPSSDPCPKTGQVARRSHWQTS